ncbi:vomeronasal 1 receptor 36 [Rattus norvegicus]|uniref:Vomeronasal type-1 receptor n=1 Tax=Rattus norvegicus TaxID=10116 RepID=A0ABK0L8K5_RAT|nr:vomeronasal 1 receptor 36 [Rattus norvegicus]|eukprot:NP_001008913.1 vomeronasal 1 receptor 36 [Rattus norvegicus]
MEKVALQILVLCQVGPGTVANALLFIHNFSPIVTDSQMRPIQIIQTNLAIANVFIILLLFFTNNMTVGVLKRTLTDLSCKCGYFLYLVARSSNMCFTCALSTYQFVTLVSGNWGRVLLRGRATKVVSYSCYSCWLFSILNNAYIPMKISGSQKPNNGIDVKVKWVCSISDFSVGMNFLRFAHDIIFISIMLWTSVSMVLLLRKHHQRLQHIHTPIQDHRGYAEIRACHTILMVVVTFVSFYFLDCICTFFRISFVNTCLWLGHVKEVLAVSFPTIYPLILIFRGPKDHCSLFFTVQPLNHVTR